jgi:hypothetical protein
VSGAVIVLERPGRELCDACDGDVGSPCRECGGSGTLPFRLPRCTCGERLERYGWHEIFSPATGEQERLSRYFCQGGHVVAIRFLPVAERQAA